MGRHPGVTRIAAVVSLLISSLAVSGCAWLLYPEYESLPGLLLHEEFRSDQLDDRTWESTRGPSQQVPVMREGRLYVFGPDNTIATVRGLPGAFTTRVDWAVISDSANGIDPLEPNTPDYRVRLERPEVNVELTLVDDLGLSTLRIVPAEGAVQIVETPWEGVTAGHLLITYVPSGPAKGVFAEVPELDLSTGHQMSSRVILGTRLAFTVSGTSMNPRCVEMVSVYEQ